MGLSVLPHWIAVPLREEDWVFLLSCKLAKLRMFAEVGEVNTCMVLTIIKAAWKEGGVREGEFPSAGGVRRPHGGGTMDRIALKAEGMEGRT